MQRPPSKNYGPEDPSASLYSLRAELRRVTESDRERQCGLTSCRCDGPGIEALGRPGAWDSRWIGVMTCGHIWTCPVCSRKLRTVRLAKLTHAIRMAGGTWQMLTLTVRHRDGMPLRSLHGGLMAAWRRARQGGATQRIWRERVTASARATEITRSSNGWHPHLHVLVRTEGFTEAERDVLLERWLLCVERELGPACVPSREHAIRWSTPIDVCSATEADRASYLAKLGLELAGPKAGRSGSLSPWQIAKAAARGDERSRDLWREFQKATRGRRMLELDDRASRWSKRPDPDALLDGREPAEKTRVVVPVDVLEMRALKVYERRDPGILGAILESVRGTPNPEATVKRWLDLVTRALSYTPQNGHRVSTQGPRSSVAWRPESRGPPTGQGFGGPDTGHHLASHRGVS